MEDDNDFYSETNHAESQYNNEEKKISQVTYKIDYFRQLLQFKMRALAIAIVYKIIKISEVF